MKAKLSIFAWGLIFVDENYLNIKLQEINLYTCEEYKIERDFWVWVTSNYFDILSNSFRVGQYLIADRWWEESQGKEYLSEKRCGIKSIMLGIMQAHNGRSKDHRSMLIGGSWRDRSPMPFKPAGPACEQANCTILCIFNALMKHCPCTLDRREICKSRCHRDTFFSFFINSLDTSWELYALGEAQRGFEIRVLTRQLKGCYKVMWLKILNSLLSFARSYDNRFDSFKNVTRVKFVPNISLSKSESNFHWLNQCFAFSLIHQW